MDLVERLANTYSGVVHDVMRAMGLRNFTLPPEIRPLFPDRVLAGVAATFKGKVIAEDLTKWPDQLDFSAELTKVRNAKPDAVFVFYPGAAGVQFLTQPAIELARNATLFPVSAAYSAQVVLEPPAGLDEKALVDILTEPKNALVKQYQKLFEFEDVRLRFSDGALRAVARQALARKSGARGLRSILENVMLELMYDLPSRDDVEECVINEEVIEQGAKPLLVLKQEAESA